MSDIQDADDLSEYVPRRTVPGILLKYFENYIIIYIKTYILWPVVHFTGFDKESPK